MAHYERLVGVNIKGVMNGCYLAKPLLRKSAHGKIINLSSASAIYGQPGLAMYSGSKFFVRGFTEALDLEYASEGIRVVDIMPLFVKTPMIDEIKTGSIKKIKLRITPEKVADTVSRLIQTPNKKLNTHNAVDKASMILGRLSKYSPDKINAWVNGRLNH